MWTEDAEGFRGRWSGRVLSGSRVLATLALTALAIMLAAAAAAGPAAAQDGAPVEATGTLADPGVTSYQYGTHAITDEAAGTTYALQSETVDLDRYVGERVTISGATVPGYEEGAVEGGPALIQVSDVETVDQGSGGDQYSDGQVEEPEGAPQEPESGDEDTDAPPMLPDTGGIGVGAALLAAGLMAGGAVLWRRR